MRGKTTIQPSPCPQDYCAAEKTQQCALFCNNPPVVEGFDLQYVDCFFFLNCNYCPRVRPFQPLHPHDITSMPIEQSCVL